MNKSLKFSNIITLSRILLSIPLVYLLLTNNKTYAILLFLLIVSTDAVDGKIARVLEQETKFGRNFDYTADVLFGASIYFTQVLSNKVPDSIVMSALINYFIVGVLFYIGFKKAKVIHVPKIKKSAGAAYYSFLLLLILNIYNTWTLVLIVLCIVYMYYFSIEYFFELKEKSLV